MRLAKILMNVADGSPGGGSAPSSTPAQGSAPAASSSPPAAAPPAAPIDTAAIVQQVAQQVQNATFAALRKAGVLDGQQPRGTTPPAASSSTPNDALSRDEVSAMVARQSELAFALGQSGATPEQATLMRTLFNASNPENVADWVSSTARTLGISKPNPTQPSTPPAASPPNPAPASNGGAPAAPQPSFSEAPWTRTKDSVDSLVREKGFAGAAFELRAQVQRALAKTKVTW